MAEGGASGHHEVWGTVTSDDQCSASDVAFGFMDPQFSDCVLRLLYTRKKHTDSYQVAPEVEQGAGRKRRGPDRKGKASAKGSGKEGGGSAVSSERAQAFKGPRTAAASEGGSESDGETLEYKIPGNALLLSSKSPVFKRMFSPGFREGNGTKEANITVDATEAKGFPEAIHFLYHKTVSAPVAGDMDSLCALLLVADRFDIGVVRTACTELMDSLVGNMTPAHAEGVVSLPSSLQALPGLRKVVVAARSKLREMYAPAFRGGEALKPFLGLSEAAVAFLLESSTLDVTSEDKVLQAGETWAATQTSEARLYLELMALAVLPRVRIPYLSPKCTLQLTTKMLGLLKTLPQVNRDSIEDAPAPLQAWASGEVVSSSSELPAEATRTLVAFSQLAHCLDKMRAADLPVPSNILDWYLPGSRQLAPRAGYRKPDVTMQLDISWETCQKMKPGVWLDPARDLEVITSAFVSRRRLEMRSYLVKGEGSQDQADWTLAAFIIFHAAASSADGGDFPMISNYAVRQHGSFQITRRGALRKFSKDFKEWGFKDVCCLPWAKVLEEKQVYFPHGFLGIRVQSWFQDKGPCDEESV